MYAQLFHAVRQQADAARRCKQAEGRIGRQSMVRNQGGQRDVDVGCKPVRSVSERMTRGVLQANGTVAPEPMMDAKHVADAVRHIAALPLGTNILNMTLMASTMPFVGRG